MKNLFLLTIFLLTLAGGEMTYAQQSTITSSELKKFKAIDDSLELVYNQVLKDYSSEPKFIKHLKKSQSLWKQMRDANLSMRFPKKDDNPSFYGSSFSACYYQLASTYTRERITLLSQWLKGIPEGDVCAGSIHIKKAE